MALYPKNFNGQERLQEGGRGEMFQANLPGYRQDADRINRTNNKLNVSEHDVPNIKYQMDHRLPVLFTYGYAYGYNQMVMPKGRVVGVDPYMDLVDFDTHKKHNVLTLANGGVPVRLRTGEDKYKTSEAAKSLVSKGGQGQTVFGINKEWVSLAGMDASYNDNSMRAFNATGPLKILADANYKIDGSTGKVVDETGQIVDTVRPANTPIGIIQRNEYTRDNDAHNGMIPGPILTDALVELPWFAYKDKAEQNPWGSAYGGLFPGALVKSDENGRMVTSPLSYIEELTDLSMTEYELERQQVIGQVYSVTDELVPEGSAKWVTWSLEDRLKFEDFNPETYPSNNRRGEDAIGRSPHHSTGGYPGYPYDKAFSQHDLHMLSSGGRFDNYNRRMNQEYQYENLGIPGLTDGKNAAVREYQAEVAGRVHYAGGNDYVEMFFRTSEVDLAEGTLEIAVGDDVFTTATEGAILKDFLQIKYADEKQGIVVLEVSSKDNADKALKEILSMDVKLRFSKRGQAGVPTFMDWDGVIGSVKILLTK